MSPRGAILALSIATAISASALALLAPPWTSITLLVIASLSSILLNHGYARSLATKRRPQARVVLDRLVAIEIGVAFIPSLAIAGLLQAGIAPGIELNPIWAAIVGVVAGLMTICFLSSLIDWYYVLPRRDGLIGEPPCKAPGQGLWARVTWFWLLHRFAAAVATIGGVYAIAICLGIWLYQRFPDVSGGVGGIPVLVGIVTFFGSSYLRYIGQVWQLLFTPSASMGEFLETRVEGHPLSGFVLNMAIERVDLLKQNDILTHASHADIAKYCHHNSGAALCATECVRGNAEESGKAPTGGHGGCLFETEERYLEASLERSRVFVF